MNAHVPPALVQCGMVGTPEYPALQVAEVQLPTAVVVADPVQPYPVGAMQAAALGEGGEGRNFDGRAGRGGEVMPFRHR